MSIWSASSAQDPSEFSVLTVCTGNICRSPAAQFLLDGGFSELGWTSVKVHSAGLGAVVGAPMEPIPLKFLDQLGIDGTQFAARQLVADLARGSDLILTMTREQRDDLVSRHPTAARRVFTLVEFQRLVFSAESLAGFDPQLIGNGDPESLRSLVNFLSRRRAAAQLTEADDISDPYRLAENVQWEVMQQVGEVCVSMVRGMTSG